MDNNNTSILLIVEKNEIELYNIYEKIKREINNIQYFIINYINDLHKLEQKILLTILSLLLINIVNYFHLDL